MVPFRGVWVCWEEALELGRLVESVRDGIVREELEVGACGGDAIYDRPGECREDGLTPLALR